MKELGAGPTRSINGAELCTFAKKQRMRGVGGPELLRALFALNAGLESPLSDHAIADIALWADELPARTWEPPVPLERVERPPFPTDELPSWAANWTREEATATQTPEDLPGVLALAASAAALTGKLEIKVNHGYSEPTNTYAVVAMPPASRKTQVLSDATRPIRQYEHERVEASRAHVARAHAELEILRERAQNARRAVARAPEQDRRKRLEEALILAEEVAIAELALPIFPRLIADDATPEALARLLHQQGARIAVISPEGQEVLELIRGRYSANARSNLGVYLSAWSGDPLRIDRVNRAPILVARPLATICLVVQPAVIQGLVEREFRDRGLLGRFLFSIPESLIGRRDARAPAMSEETAAEYGRHVRRLLEIPVDSRVVPLEDDARELWLRFEEELEPRRAENGDLGHIADWAGKLGGGVARLAGVLHAMESANEADPLGHPVEVLAMERAIHLGRYFIDHARIAFDIMGADPNQELAGRIWRWISEKGLAAVTRREIQQQFKGGGIRTSADLEAPLGILIEHGYLRRNAAPERKPGRKTEGYEVNPLAAEAR